MKTEWKEGAVLRRDARHTKLPEDEATRPHPGKKDTKKWCRGKEGHEHVLKCVPYSHNHAFLRDWRALVCEKCGKQLDYYAPPLDTVRYPVVKPKWVTS